MSRVKILYIHHAKGWGGAPINMINIINGLDKDLFEVTVLLLKESDLSKHLIRNNISYKVVNHWFYKYYYRYYSHSLPGYIKWQNIIKNLHVISSWFLSKYVFAIQVLNEFNPDIIHLNSSALSDWLAPSKRMAKVLIHIQEPISRGRFGVRYNFIRKQLVSYADKIIAISEDNSKRIDIPHLTKIIYNFTDDYSNMISEKSFYNKSILYVGGTLTIKGFYLMVNAIRHIDPEIKIFFIANFERRANLFPAIIKSIIPLKHNKKLKLAITFLKSCPNVLITPPVENIKNHFHHVSCLVSPFTVPHFSRPIIEAFSCMKPVIATNIPGMDEIVSDGINGYLVAPDSKTLAKLINEVLNNPEELIKKGRNGYSKYLKYYSENNCEQWNNVYRDLAISNTETDVSKKFNK